MFGRTGLRRGRGRRRQSDDVPARPAAVAIGARAGWEKYAAIGQVVAATATAAAVLVTGVTTWAALESVEVGRDQAEIAEQGQLTDRFTSAVEQLGSDQEGVRLGGIFALERIARDSERDQAAVIEVLCAFVRLRAPVSGTRPTPPRPAGSASAVPPTGRGAVHIDVDSDASAVDVAVDVNAAVRVVARRTVRPDRVDIVDLSRTRLGGIKLPTTEDADFRLARFAGADLVAADLARANLTGANLEGVSAREVRMVGVLSRASLVDADLTGAVLAGAWLDNTSMDHAILNGASLTGTKFRGARLNEVELRDAQLGGAELQEAYLNGADLTGAELASAKLKGANLSGATLTGVTNVNLAQLREAIIDSRTVLPSGFTWTHSDGVQVTP
ncbi:pentapeptide repeat-containing protein [Plantactinospora endophytica]|uniref:Pentapeptide repeat-containing protein n=1 Tax=Plantactinospora endophytica TaxID=673535 RepID=A0ABQ4DV24_9ACTN|nr:pentapeptide repeat-containing protein [Plantactinospora endophytica]GIG86287.1 hypothetical protein Pen02_12230 [Plantactinospora endophytica]